MSQFTVKLLYMWLFSCIDCSIYNLFTHKENMMEIRKFIFESYDEIIFIQSLCKISFLDFLALE